MRFKISIIRANNGTEFVNDEDRYNRTAKTSLDFKSPDRIVGEYFSKCNNVLTVKTLHLCITCLRQDKLLCLCYNILHVFMPQLRFAGGGYLQTEPTVMIQAIGTL